jgi:hypothetical protein
MIHGPDVGFATSSCFGIALLVSGVAFGFSIWLYCGAFLRSISIWAALLDIGIGMDIGMALDCISGVYDIMHTLLVHLLD